MDWQTLLYPLGLFSSTCFCLRVLYQWYFAERAGKSIVTKGFWVLSLAGNITFLIHSIIQQQLPMTLIQSTQIVISWRNLNLMGPIEKRMELKRVFILIALSVTTALLIYSWNCEQMGQWHFHRIPTHALQQVKEVSFPWIVLGSIGMFLFASRFWVQWIISERETKSLLSTSFWVFSCVGGVLSLAFYIKTGDFVNAISPLVGLLPYVRNLFFLERPV